MQKSHHIYRYLKTEYGTFFARTVYIVDTKGKIAYKQVIAHIEKEPNYKDILAALKDLLYKFTNAALLKLRLSVTNNL
jgi:peroxiredoxin